MHRLIQNIFTKSIIVSIALIFVPPAVVAELEEVVVTATKRETSEQDIPISIETVSGDLIQKMGINNLDDLAESVPNLTVGYGITSQLITIRGLGTGQERSFEQAVGMFVDGFYMPRSRQYQSAMFDVHRVEVSRGPQAVIHGLNATAGAISIVSNKTMPGDAFHAQISADYELEYGGPSVSGSIGGSPSDTLGLHAAFKYSDRDGFYKNTLTGVDEGDTEEVAVRLTAVWELQDNLTLTGKYEYSETDMDGNTGELFGTPASTATESPPLTSEVDGVLNWKRSSNGCNPDAFGGTALTDPLGIFPISCPGQFTTSDNILGKLEWEVADHVVTVLGGRSEFEYDIVVDIDTGPLSIIDTQIDEEFEQNAVEIRLTSPQGKTFEYMGGFYYQDWENRNRNPRILGPTALLGGFGPTTGIYSAAIFDQSSELLSVFGQLSYNFNDKFRITGGLRYVDEDKTSIYSSICSLGDVAAGVSADAGVLRPTLEFLGLCPEARVDGILFSRNSDDLMPEVSAQWHVNEDFMVYAKWGESSKSGGFQAVQSNLTTVFDPEYGDESAEGYEIGFKSRWLDNSAELNVTLFRNEFDDLQVTSFLIETTPTGAPIATAVINNAAKAVSQGIEVDARWQASDWLLIGGAFAYLDAEFDSFAVAPCHSSAVTATGTCDQSGRPLPLAADYSGNVYLNTAYPLSGNINFIADVNVSFSGEYFTDGPLDPIGLQDDWTKLSARVGIAAADDRWSLAVVGRNLTQEEVLASSQVFTPTFFGYLYPPRTVMLQGSYRFGGE